MDLPIAPLGRHPAALAEGAHHAVAWRASAKPLGLHGRFARVGDFHLAGERLDDRGCHRLAGAAS